jgi:PDZ domain-containing protein
MRRPGWKTVAAIFVVLGASGFGYAWQTDSGSYAFLPDPANPTDEVVRVPGEDPPRGDSGFYFVDVSVLRANLVEEFWARHLVDGADVVPADRVIAPGETEEERRERNLHAMAASQRVAQVVAERELGLEVEIERRGALVTAVENGLAADRAGIRAGDTVLRAGGRRVRSAAELIRATRRLEPGDAVRLVLRRAGPMTLRTVASDDDPPRAIVGIGVADDVRIGRLPVRVRFSVPGIGGPSAGLAFALEIYDSLSERELLDGHRVAVTGELGLDGQVFPIGGVVQKAHGALDVDADTMLVPAGDNFRDARRAADGRLRVIAVRTFDGALAAVRGLPPPAES